MDKRTHGAVVLPTICLDAGFAKHARRLDSSKHCHALKDFGVSISLLR